MRPLRTPVTLALLLGLLAAPSGGAREPEFVELAVLSYNTHGLPSWIARDDPVARFPRIAERADHYDLVLLQEDFQHHALLVEHTGHPHVLRGNDPRNPLVNGDGLTVLASRSVRTIEPSLRHAYGTCSGWVGNAHDCWATKGLFGVRVTLANGASLDAYDLHLDAGREEPDRIVRHEQLRQVAEQIRRESDGRAVIIAGDFNMSFDDDEERKLMMQFRKELALEDPGIDPRDSPLWTNRIDYMFFRQDDRVRMDVIEAGVAEEFHWEDAPLSDHPALFVRFRVSVPAIAVGSPPTPEDP